jgi:hypothetical protein
MGVTHTSIITSRGELLGVVSAFTRRLAELLDAAVLSCADLIVRVRTVMLPARIGDTTIDVERVSEEKLRVMLGDIEPETALQMPLPGSPMTM